MVSEEIYKQRLQKVHGDKITLVSGYKGISFKAVHRCNKHAYEYEMYPYAALRGQECRCCMKEKLRGAALISEDEAKRRLFNIYGNEFELCETYHGVSEKHKFKHNLKDGTSHMFTTTFSLLYLGEGCGICSNNRVLIGYNDIATTNPSIASLFANKEDTFKYVELSNHEVEFICPDCGQYITQSIARVVKENRVLCPHCSDGISYPNKFIYNCMSQLLDKLDFIYREYKPSWCKFDFMDKQKTGIYDIYFGINGKEYIIEMDGGFHDNPHAKSGLSTSDSKYIDGQKDSLARKHGIQIIRIDCNYPKISERYSYIKHNILNSDLAKIIDLSCINFNEVDIKSMQSLLIESCKMWNNGNTVNHIGELLSVSVQTVRSYLIAGNKCGLCDYSKELSKIRSNMQRPVICLNNMAKYNSITEAAKEYNFTSESIRSCCCGKALSSGEENGNRLVWRYLDEFEHMTKEDIRKHLIDAYSKKVVCISKGILFATIKDAAEWVGVSSSAISKCCSGLSKSCGKDTDKGTPMHWKYYNDYIINNDIGTLSLYGRLGA